MQEERKNVNLFIVELKFKINKYYLLAHALKSNRAPFAEWVGLSNKLWNISNDGYWFLFNPSMQDKIFAKINDANFDTFFIEIKNDIEKIFSTAFKSKEFLKLYKETKKYKKFLGQEWNDKKKMIIATTEEILGEKLPHIKLDVLVTHPNLRNGIVLLELNTICWGHKEDWKNYSMIYLMHETLHFVLDKKLGRNHLTHSIIELISDNELRIRLNGKGKYFKEQKENVGHLFLRKMEKALFPSWKKYLKNKAKNIAQFYNEINANLEIKKILEQLSEDLNTD